MSYPNATKTRPVVIPDPIDRFLDAPLPIDEAAAVLAYYLPLVVDHSPPYSIQNEFLIARLHCAAAIGHRLGRAKFFEASMVAEQYENLRRGRDVADEYMDWTADDFNDAISTRIDAILGGAQ